MITLVLPVRVSTLLLLDHLCLDHTYRPAIKGKNVLLRLSLSEPLLQVPKTHPMKTTKASPCILKEKKDIFRLENSSCCVVNIHELVLTRKHTPDS